jgi:septin family protein
MTTEESDMRVSEAMKKFPIVKFDFERNANKAMSACSFALVGSSKSGKTTFLKFLLKKHFDDDIKVLMTQSPSADIYNSLKKDCAFAPAYIPDIIKTCYLINKHTKNHYPFCCIIDDCVAIKNDRQMVKLMCLYRNSRISAVVCGQDLTLLNATGRANVNNLCLFAQNTDNRMEDNIKNFLRTYFPKNLSMDEKIELYKKLTADHCFFFVDQLEGTIKRCKLLSNQIVE